MHPEMPLHTKGPGVIPEPQSDRIDEYDLFEGITIDEPVAEYA